MKVLFLHGWQSVPGGVKPTYLARHGIEVINPPLPDEDFDEAVRIAQIEYDRHRPAVVVGSSRGGAVAMNLDSGDTPLVLLCPAWKKYGTARTVRKNTTVLHPRADDVVPFADSEELVRTSGLPASALVEVGNDHRLADPEPLAAMLEACHSAVSAAEAPTFGVREPGTAYTERRAAYGVVFGAAETVAVVRGPSGRFWLPGGGSLPGESAEDTLPREVREELGRGVRLTHRLGEATQFFHAASEDRHYRMQAVFFRADFAGRSSTGGEHELCWHPLDQAGAAFDHECHGWAVGRAAASERRLLTRRR
jgi:8-oxo-dGTP pyrophosphatase MutT (NUDIX family)